MTKVVVALPKLAIGQRWLGRSLLPDAPDEPEGYRFQILYRSRYRGRPEDTRGWSNCWLAVKTNVDHGPYGIHNQCWWFDNDGHAELEDRTPCFQLTRLLRSSAKKAKP